MSDESVNILLFLAQGFEDLEAIVTLDVFGWTHYRENIRKAVVTTTGFHSTVRGRFGLQIQPDLPFSEVISHNYRALVVPGGFYSYGYNEAFDQKIYRLARDIHSNGGYIATMCVGILPIAEAGLLKEKRATTYPYSRKHDNLGRLKENGAHVVEDPVVMDNRIISCNGAGSSLEVAFLLMECLMGLETTNQVQHYMIYRGMT